MELATLDESWQPTEIPPQPGSIIDLGLNFNPGELIAEHDKVIFLHNAYTNGYYTYMFD